MFTFSNVVFNSCSMLAAVCAHPGCMGLPAKYQELQNQDDAGLHASAALDHKCTCTHERGAFVSGRTSTVEVA